MPRTYECSFCGARGPATKDHVPPRSVFGDPAPSALTTVRACSACNSGASQDDEYFRDTIVKYHRVADLPAAESAVAAMIRAAAKPEKRKYAKATLARFAIADVRTPAGIELGRRPVVRVDANRIRRAAIRYVRGLYRHEVGVTLPGDSEFVAIVEPEGILAARTEVERAMASGTRRVIQEGVFWYVYVVAADNPAVSIWLLVFFDAYPILVVARRSTSVAPAI